LILRVGKCGKVAISRTGRKGVPFLRNEKKERDELNRWVVTIGKKSII